MPSLVYLDLDNVQPPEILPAGTEALVRIAKIQDKTVDDSGNPKPYPCLLIWLELPDHVNAPGLSHLLSFPGESDTEKQAYAKKQDIKQFMEIFNLDSLDTDDWVGAETFAILGTKVYNGKDSNTIQNFVTAG